MGFLLIGYTIAFGSWDNDSMSKWATFLFQMAFVGKVINTMSGGVSECVKIIPLMVFTVIVSTLLYPLIVNISWGADFLKNTFLDLHMYDLAGSTVIHSTGGWTLLAAIMIIGSKRNRYTKDGEIHVIPASNIPLVILGALYSGSVGSVPLAPKRVQMLLH